MIWDIEADRHFFHPPLVTLVSWTLMMAMSSESICQPVRVRSRVI